MKHWETHLYGYAYAVLQTQDNADAMRAKAISHGHTEGECLCVARDPQHYITNGTFAPNYPGGFNATRVCVCLYEDGRTNFHIVKALGCISTIDCDERGNVARAVKFQEIDVTGLDWGEIIQEAYKSADTMRGCTWDEWVLSGNIGTLDPNVDYGLSTELTPAGEQGVFLGCERNLSPKATQLDLF